MRNTIILAGGYGLDMHNASAVRALGLAQMIGSLDYKVVGMGKFQSAPDGARAPGGVMVDGIISRDIQQPLAGRAIGSYVTSAEPLMQVVDELGAERVLAVLCYNYPARGAWSMIRQAGRRGIAPILDCTEWYGWEGSKVLRNLWRLAGVEMRMRVLTRLAGNVSCASRCFQARVAGQYTVLWPFVLNTTRPEWQRGPVPAPARTVNLIYSGSPVPGIHKGRLP